MQLTFCCQAAPVSSGCLLVEITIKQEKSSKLKRDGSVLNGVLHQVGIGP
jgi:hypothetical protein